MARVRLMPLRSRNCAAMNVRSGASAAIAVRERGELRDQLRADRSAAATTRTTSPVARLAMQEVGEHGLALAQVGREIAHERAAKPASSSRGLICCHSSSSARLAVATWLVRRAIEPTTSTASSARSAAQHRDERLVGQRGRHVARAGP